MKYSELKKSCSQMLLNNIKSLKNTQKIIENPQIFFVSISRCSQILKFEIEDGAQSALKAFLNLPNTQTIKVSDLNSMSRP